MKRRLLIIGSGGREHAIGKALLKSPLVDTVYCAKGNPGMINDGIKCINIEETDSEALIQFAKDKVIDWVIVGPEVPLLAGLVDDLESVGIKAFGPSQEAAIIEGSKEFAKELMIQNQIPTARYASFSDYEKACDYVLSQPLPIVIKADGLAAGKGVTIAHHDDEALQALRANLIDNVFNNEHPKVVIEEFLEGQEFSLLSFVSEEGVYPMPAAKDYKPIFDGDKGPNTGGMGMYCPVPYVSPVIYQKVIDTIILPTVEGMKRLGKPFTGVLYTGLILTNEGPKVIEYNARFGDPETQIILQRLDSDLALVMESLLNNEPCDIQWKEHGVNLGVVVSAKGYPGKYETGQVVRFKQSEQVELFYAGVGEVNHDLVTQGGRVLMVEVFAENMEEAREKVYGYLDKQPMDNLYCRQDIGE